MKDPGDVGTAAGVPSLSPLLPCYSLKSMVELPVAVYQEAVVNRGARPRHVKPP